MRFSEIKRQLNNMLRTKEADVQLFTIRGTFNSGTTRTPAANFRMFHADDTADEPIIYTLFSQISDRFRYEPKSQKTRLYTLMHPAEGLKADSEFDITSEMIEAAVQTLINAARELRNHFEDLSEQLQLFMGDNIHVRNTPPGESAKLSISTSTEETWGVLADLLRETGLPIHSNRFTRSFIIHSGGPGKTPESIIEGVDALFSQLRLSKTPGPE
ncbi:MAG: hypothetical protein K0U10_01250 [Gammaproteobacteria bacterium]|nr:hypothetical protein [Gammaproteobacteria bacterium]